MTCNSVQIEPRGWRGWGQLIFLALSCAFKLISTFLSEDKSSFWTSIWWCTAQLPDACSTHKRGSWCSPSPATKLLHENWDVFKFRTVSWSSVVCNLTACHLSFSSEVPFPLSHRCGEVFPARLCAVCPWSSSVVFPTNVLLSGCLKASSREKVSEARVVLFCLPLRCYLPSPQMQLAPSASLSCFVWSRGELRESREATHINNRVWNQLIWMRGRLVPEGEKPGSHRNLPWAWWDCNKCYIPGTVRS